MTIRPAPDVAPPGIVRYVVLYGSWAHGTQTPTSDEDWRGVYQAPNDHFLGLNPPDRTWEQKPDITIWELAHFCRLLLGGNPNIIGLLSAPDDCIATISPVVTILRAARGLFVSRSMAAAYTGWMVRELRDLADPRRADLPKRLSHLPRLMWELEGAIDAGEVPVRAADWKRDYIMDVKLGRRGYDEVALLLNERLPSLEARGAVLPEPPRAFVEQVLLDARHADG